MDMAGKRRTIGKLIDAVTDRLSELLGSLGPEPKRIPIPVRDNPRGH